MSHLVVVVACAIVAGACQGSGRSPSSGSTPPSAGQPSRASSSAASTEPSATRSTRELPGSGRLPAGLYTRSSFQPPITVALDEGWSVGSVSRGFFDVQQQPGTPDVIAVQFANVIGVVGAGRQQVEATAAAEVAAAIAQNPGLTVLGESDSRLGGLTGFTIEVENATDAHVGILDVPPGRLGIDPERRLWLSLFDTDFGVLAVMVGGSVESWDHALLVAEPVLESVAIG